MFSYYEADLMAFGSANWSGNGLTGRSLHKRQSPPYKSYSLQKYDQTHMLNVLRALDQR
ncbi:hypothetical protein ACIQXV_06390 [Neobacillus sp. NPDC097160]|uniref:hypothetical protein n=1 Tax=Neobacillus sp. NPDC097160 TaxID=3364298 RepID=UPI003802360A